MEWISVKERLPENDRLVLIRHCWGVCLGNFLEGKWHSRQYSKLELKSACYWCDIPELPPIKEKEEKEPKCKVRAKEYPENIICAIWGEKDISNLELNADFDVLEERIEKMLDELYPREKDVLHYRYKEQLTLQVIAEKYDLCAQRIRQIEAKALRKLRSPRRSSFIKTGIDVEVEKKRILENAIKQKESTMQNMSFDKIGVEHLDLSVRSYNCLKRAGYNTLKDLLMMSDDDFWRVRNMGAKSIEEVKEKIKQFR